MKSFKQTFFNEDVNNINGFAMLKPGFLNYEDDFTKMLNNNGWTIVRKEKHHLTEPQAHELYKMHANKDFYNDLCKYMSSDDSLCCLCYKDCEDPIKDMNTIKDKVRKAWGRDEMHNCMHSADSLDNVNRESKLIFENKVIESIDQTIQSIDNFGFIDNNIMAVNSIGDKVEEDPKYLMKISELKLDFSYQEFLQLIDMLNDALAEELLAWYHYSITAPFLYGKFHHETLELFEETAKDEFEDHAQWLMQRLQQFGVTPSRVAHPSMLDEVATHKYIMPTFDTAGAIINNIEAERGAIETYTKIESFTKDKDITTHSKIEEILKDEQEHLQKLQNIYKDITTEVQ